MGVSLSCLQYTNKKVNKHPVHKFKDIHTKEGNLYVTVEMIYQFLIFFLYQQFSVTFILFTDIMLFENV